MLASKMKRRRDTNQKITAFLSTLPDHSLPPTKRATRDRGTLSGSEDRNTASSQGGGSRASASADGAKHRTGYNSRWEADHRWIFYVEGEGTYCKLCRKFDTKNHQNQSKV